MKDNLQNNLQNNLPEWHYQKLDAVIEMSNDGDGLISACLLSHLTGYPITDFTDVKVGIFSTIPLDRRERISVDLAKVKGKGYDNHFMGFSEYTIINYEMINVNNQKEIILGLKDYPHKFGMNTIFVIYASFKDRISLPKSEKLLKILLTFDSAYKGYYTHRKSFIENLEFIGLKEELLPIFEKHTLQDFEELSKRVEAEMPKNFYLNWNEDEETGLLEFSSDKEVQARAERFLERLSKELGFPIALPKEQFRRVQWLADIGKRSINKTGDISHDRTLYCYAIISRYSVKSSYLKGHRIDHWRRICQFI